MHAETFKYLNPTDEQLTKMTIMRGVAAEYASFVDAHLPEGPDKTYILRKFREVAMWVNIAITRNPDGSPRT